MKTREPIENQPARIDLASIRARMAATQGQHYWRSLEELAGTDSFTEMLHREFPDGASEWWDGLSRRNFLKMAAASLALAGLNGCTKQPVEEIYPYVKQPERLVLGEPLMYATSMVLGGFATGVLAKSREGHPIKVDGNPQHPASPAGANAWMQASILDLYDPDRSTSVTHNGEISNWSHFLADLNELLREQETSGGAGLRLLTETVTSPSLIAQIGQILAKFPKAKWHQYEPLNRDNVRAGAQLAFGEVVETLYHFDKAAVIVSLESDFLYEHPDRLRHTLGFVNGRRLSAGRREMSRLYVAESTPTITGSMADHRQPFASGDILALSLRLAGGTIGLDTAGEWSPSAEQQTWLSALLEDLRQHRGASIVIVGDAQPPEVHALAHVLNEQLGNVGRTVEILAPSVTGAVHQLQSLRELAEAIQNQAVEALFVLGGNPAYTAPCDFGFDELLPRVKRSIHSGLYLDETGARCTWHIPEAHYLESWGDARSYDGTVSLQQPLIAPLYGGKTALEVLGAMVKQQPIRTAYEILREHWQKQNRWPDFDSGWRKSLHDGFIEGTRSPARSVRARKDWRPPRIETPTDKAALELSFRADPTVWDGRFANNGWLLECPKPISKLTWDNAVVVSPLLAERLKLANDDVVEVTFSDRALQGPIWVMPGQAENSVTIHLGYGRSRAGRIGTGVGFNAYQLRASQAPWFGAGVKLRKTGRVHHLVATQTHHSLEGEDRQIYRRATWEEYLGNKDVLNVETPGPETTLYYPNEYPYDGYKWAMSIDLGACIGCNACLLACNVENNIPVVGKDQVGKNREMFWIRIDTYYQGSVDNPEFNHMPVPCMHCEHAPCELVCPTAATVHDHEGLNLQIYNRCVGTRFCSNNCPYKVRRFNFLKYARYDDPSGQPMHNPEVTVRWRGVMEKCTYCVQRIAAGRITAEKENRRMQDGEVQTACQQACPAQAIVFGDLNAPESKVARLKTHPLNYAMLGQLNTRPRTTYLARIANPKSGKDRETAAEKGKA